MSQYETDEEQIAAIKEWWKKNGASIISSVLIVAVSWTGWSFYQKNQQSKSENASAIFNVMQMSFQQGNFGDVSREGLKLLNEQPSSPYSSGVAFLLAKDSHKKNKTEEVIKHLSWVVEHSEDDSLVLIAKLRIVNVYLELEKLDEANATLSGIKSETLTEVEQSTLAYSKAVVALKSNKTSDAIVFLEQVISNKKSNGNLVNLAQIQLDDLAK